MIISRTPFRISLFGGGTDYPVWFTKHGGATLGTTIDKYCYISARYLPPYFKHKSRIVYSQEEWVNDNNDIKHPAVRECLRFMNVTRGIEICHQSDLLAKKGLGSSSAFVVGLLLVLDALKNCGATMGKDTLAQAAISAEQDWIKETVGCQDQYLSAYGGFNYLNFNPNGIVDVTPITPPKALQSYLMLFDTGTSRIASELAAKQIEQIPHKGYELTLLNGFTDIAVKLLREERLEDIGRLMHESWELKKSLSSEISTLAIDTIYDSARQAGAMGGKILGAGGGGFILFLVTPDKTEVVKRALSDLIHIPFRFENTGSQIIFNDERDRYITG